MFVTVSIFFIGGPLFFVTAVGLCACIIISCLFGYYVILTTFISVYGYGCGGGDGEIGCICLGLVFRVVCYVCLRLCLSILSIVYAMPIIVFLRCIPLCDLLSMWKC